MSVWTGSGDQQNKENRGEQPQGQDDSRPLHVFMRTLNMRFGLIAQRQN